METRLFVPADALTVGTAICVAVAACVCGLAASQGRRRARRAAVWASAIALAAFTMGAIWPRAADWQVEVLDVGQGDAVVVRRGDASWLVDTGDARPIDRGERVVVPHLRRSGVRRLRGLILSHPHRDHCGGAAAVLAAIAVDTVYVARASWDDSLYTRLRRAFALVPWRALARGDTLHTGGPDLAFAVLWPPASDDCTSGANDCSLVLHASGRDVPDLWLMGDLESGGEAQLLAATAASTLAAHARRYGILKAGHHGSATSSTPDFIAALQPEIALLSVGAGNRYRHPGSRTLQTLAVHDCQVLRTDRGGAVRIVLRGATLWLERPATRRVALTPTG
jgi:competence protein ComEC